MPRLPSSPEVATGVVGLTALLLLSDSPSDLVVVALLVSPFVILGGMYLAGLAGERR